MRLFLAISLPDTHRDALRRLQSRLPAGRKVPEDNLHLTLVFLGDGTSRMMDELHSALESRPISLPALRISGLDQFGGQAPRSVWARVQPNAPLADAVARLEHTARSVGFEIPRRKYVPHVTLARFAKDSVSPAFAAGFLEKESRFELLDFQPYAFSLFQSHLRQDGPTYIPLADYPIRPDPTI